MPKISLKNIELNYHVKYSDRRRSVQVRIIPPGNIEVVAPAGVPNSEIERILQQKNSWIVRQLIRLKNLADNPLNSVPENGARFLFLGRPRQLSVSFTSGKKIRILLEDDRLLIHLPEEFRKDATDALRGALKKWYIRSAAGILTEKTAFWAEKIGVRPRRINIKDQKTRWGSASPRGNVNYNWRIIMAPPSTLDYLVIHELCHIKVPNHSGAFWLLVSQAKPDYKKHRAWLRQHGPLLARLLEVF